MFLQKCEENEQYIKSFFIYFIANYPGYIQKATIFIIYKWKYYIRFKKIIQNFYCSQIFLLVWSKINATIEENKFFIYEVFVKIIYLIISHKTKFLPLWNFLPCLNY